MKNKLCVLSVVSFVFICFGLILIFSTPAILRQIIKTNLVLTPTSQVFDHWRHFPELTVMEFYFFNWTNPEDVYNASVKPRFQELGPYRFMMDIGKSNITWNDNGTVTFRQQKYWFHDLQNGKNFKDKITTLNIPALGASYLVHNRNYLVRKGLSVTLSRFSSKIHVTKSVDELLFEGYPDDLTEMASTLLSFADNDMPNWKRFGLFYKRNGSTDFEGVYNIGTGINSTFGKMYHWNYWPETRYYDGHCGEVHGSSGDNFQVDTATDTITMYLPDVCRPVTLHYVGESDVNGITGNKYVLDDYTLDNGTKHPKNLCYCGQNIPSGVFNVSSCRQGAPAFSSLPHFYQGDSYYTSEIDGLQPEKNKHEFYITVEPNTGIPLKVSAKLQVNFMLQSVPSISLYENIPKRIFFPIMWFKQEVKSSADDLAQLKYLLSIPTISMSLGISLIIVDIAILLFFFYKTKKQKRNIKNQEEDIPLKLERQYRILKDDKIIKNSK